MTGKLIAAAALTALAAGCTREPAARADNRSAAEAPAPASAEPIQTRFDRTMSGQPLPRPPSPYQLLVTQATFAQGHVITCHQHTWPRFVYLQAGHLQVTNFATRQVYDFRAPAILVESIGQWHQGQVMGPGPVTLVATELVPPGQGNSTPWPPPPPAENPCRPWAE